MNKMIRLFAGLLAFFSVPSVLFAQNNDLSALNAIASTYYVRQAAEVRPMIWMHTDRQVYSPGQTLWFSLSLVQEENRRPFRLEKTLHVVLSNEKKQILKQVKLFTSGPTLSGAFSIPDSLPEGNYLLTAFTPGMTGKYHYRAAYQPLVICKENTASVPSAILPATNPAPAAFRFTHYVEGGSLISGVMNRIVFTCFDAQGRPVAANGRITNAIDTNVIRFQTGATGIGQAILPVVRNRKYTAIFTYEGKEYSETILPSPPVAWQLSVTGRSSNFIKVRVSLSDSLYKLKPVSYLIAVATGKVQFAASGKGMYEADIPLQSFPNGVATLALYNEQKELVSTRRIFVKEEAVSVSLTPNMTAWSPREFVKLNFQLNDRQNKPVASRFSVSVTDLAFTAPQPQADESMYRLLLYPWWVDKKISAAIFTELTRNPESLDQLMITAPVGGSSPYPLQTITADTARGTIRSKKGDLLSGHVVTLFSTQGGSLVLTDTTDESGRFAFPLPDFLGTARFNFQVSRNGATLKDVALQLDSLEDPLVPPYSNFVELNSAVWEQHIRKYNEGTRSSFYNNAKLAELPTAGDNIRKTDYSELIARKRVNKNSWIATPEFIDQAGEGSMANVVLSAPGVSLMGGFLVIQGGMRGISGAVTARSEPLVVVNGVQMNLGSDQGQFGMNLNISPVMNFLNTFSNRNVEFVEVLTGSQGAQYGTVGAGGVILINTSASVRTGVNDKDENRNLQHADWEGYHIPAGFPSPDYFEKQKKGEMMPDSRITLYWNGELTTDSTGKTQCGFFTSDHAGPFLVTVQGITAEGGLFRKEFVMNVKSNK